MRVLVISCVFPPEPVVSAQTSAQIAEMLANTNHTVTVVTSFPSRPAGKLFPGFSRKLVQRERTESGIEIVRCFSTLSPESRMLSRLLENLSFGLTGGWQALVGKRPQVVYANTWPIVATGLLLLVAKLRRIPVVISVQDVYPEALMTQQRIKDDGFLVRFLRWIDGVIARNSAHIIVISERFAEIYRDRRRVLSSRLSLVPNWIDSNQIDVNASGQQFRLRKGIARNDFLLVYGGNVGVAAGVETVIESIRLLANETCIRLLVAGSGSQLAACQKSAQQIPGQPVLFHSPWAAEETSEVLRAADVLVLPTQREQSLASVPSKLLSYMLAGRPVLATAVPGSDLANLLSRSQCGWVVEPDRPDLLAAQIKEVTQLDPAERQRRGNSGREYVLRNFAKDVCLPKVIRILEQAGR
jgi:colanic acid biosynthesis glycosyl transferase WcaI